MESGPVSQQLSVHRILVDCRSSPVVGGSDRLDPAIGLRRRGRHIMISVTFRPSVDDAGGFF